jgi:hypothetical protein
MKKQNKFGVMYGLANKIDLITTEHVSDYHVFHSENGKVYLCVNADSQMGIALQKMQKAVTKEKGFAFKPSKKTLYIRMIDAQALVLPKFYNLQIAVNVYGVFLQTATNTAFLQFELSGFKVTPRIDFDQIYTDDNAVFP